MLAQDLRQRMVERINNVSDKRLRVADDFLAYREERKSNEATGELLAMPGLRDAIRQAEDDIRHGRLTPYQQLGRVPDGRP